MGTKFNTQIANGSYVEKGTLSQTEWQNRNEQIMPYVKVGSYVNSGLCRCWSRGLRRPFTLRFCCPI